MSRVSEGFRRLALVVGVVSTVAAVFVVLDHAASSYRTRTPQWGDLVLAPVIGFAAWTVVRAIGWIVSGFLGRDR